MSHGFIENHKSFKFAITSKDLGTIISVMDGFDIS